MVKKTLCIGLLAVSAFQLEFIVTPVAAQSASGAGGGAGTTANNQEPVKSGKPDASHAKPRADAATTTPPASDQTSPDTVVVTGVSPAQQVVPTARPISSVYGDDMSIIDTPRSVSIITKQQLEDRQITSTQDLGQFASGTYSPAEYGLDGIPNVRGVYASLFQNGQEEIFIRNSVIPSFNQVESLDVVKGPGSATYGPPVGGPGGYVNFLTKTPAFDAPAYQIESTIGSYAPAGDSWDHYEWTLDCTGPLIKDKLAYRISYEGVEGTTFYNDTIDDKEDIFAALTWLPYGKVQVDATFQYYEVRENNDNGFNRPTQNLIDNFQYIYGPQSAPYGPVLGTATRKVYGPEGLNSPLDSDRGSKASAQVITKVELTPDMSITNYQFFERFQSRAYDNFGYDEYVPGVDLYDSRTEFHLHYDFKLFGQNIVNHDIAGVSFRAQEGTQFSDYSTEPYNHYDITAGSSTFDYATSGYPTIGGSGFGGYPIKGMPGYSAGLFGYDGHNFTDGASGQYQIYDASIFYQHSTDWTKYLTSLIGVRGDYVDANSRVPTQYLLDYKSGDFRSGTRVLNYSVFTSLVGHITPDASVYATFDRTHGFQGDANFGGLLAGPNEVIPGELRNQSDLYEAGYKMSMLKQTVYFDVDGYVQTRNTALIGAGPENEIRSRGVETDVAYQPNKNFSVTGNFTYLEANYHQVSAYEQTGAPITTGIGTPSFTAFPRGNYKLPGTPNLLFNAFATYKFDCGFGVGVGPQVQGGQNADLAGDLKIPAQFTWNANIFYRQKNWEVQVNFFNFTDERNFTSIDPTFAGNDAILEDMPFHASGTFKLRF